MAPLPVIPGVQRLTVNWGNTVLPSMTAAFVQHYSAPTLSEQDLRTLWGTALKADQFDTISPDCFISSIEVIKLDGFSPTHVFPLGGTVGGTGTGTAIPNMSAILSLRTNQRGARGRGRNFIGPVGEGSVATGALGNTDRTNLVSAWEDYFADMEAGDALPVVASYTHEEVNAILSVSVPQFCGTQRRRQSRLA